MFLLEDKLLFDFIVKLTLAMILGGMIGLERSAHNKAAGFRTMMFICMSATMFIKVGFYMVQSPELFGPVNMAIIVGNAITGIGFLGAGSIIRSNNQESKTFIVEGLTTAATIWFVAGIGFLVGISLYLHAIAATVYSLLILMLFSRFEMRMVKAFKNNLKK